MRIQFYHRTSEFYTTVESKYLYIMKTTFNLYQAFKQHETRKHGNKEKLVI